MISSANGPGPAEVSSSPPHAASPSAAVTIATAALATRTPKRRLRLSPTSFSWLGRRTLDGGNVAPSAADQRRHLCPEAHAAARDDARRDHAEDRRAQQQQGRDRVDRGVEAAAQEGEDQDRD